MQQMSKLLGRRLWDNAGSPEIDTARLLVSIGLALGSTEDIPVQHGDWKERDLRAVSPLAVQMYMPNAPAVAVALDRAAKGGIISPVMADASGCRRHRRGVATHRPRRGRRCDLRRRRDRDRGGACRGVHAAGHVVDQ